MLNRFPRILAAMGLSLTVAFTSMAASTTEARADNFDNFLGGAAALFILGAIIHELNDDDDRYPSRHYGNVGNRLVVPGHCMFTLRGNNGNHHAFGAGCVRNNIRNAHRLPSACLRSVRTPNGVRQIYGAQCLRRHGWHRS